jgi:Dyp-type peroxidase family
MSTDATGMSRRSLLKVGGAGMALGALGPIATTRMAGAAQVDQPGEEGPSIDLAEVQGNVLGGFNKDHQRLLFFRVGDRARARAWLAGLVDDVATARETVAFNDLFRAARARRGSEAGAPTTGWVNVALTHAGIAALGVPRRDLDAFPDAFRQGMAARARLLGDVDQSAPSRWLGPFGREGVHGVLLLAADDARTLRRLTASHREAMADAGVRVTFDQVGRTRVDQPGHEHFGFKDGISQPGIVGLTERQNPADDDQGLPGQDLVWPGEFVLGYPGEAGGPGGDEDRVEGPVALSGPAWTVNGSYLVFRRLRQDVPGFKDFVRRAAAQHGLSDDQLGAKIVGRYPSGAPLERTEDQPADLDTTAGDPSVADPSLLDPMRINDFEFGDDPDGLVVPLGAHIRKTYPRDQPTPTGAEADTQTHRLLRRGIPYGQSFRPGAARSSPQGPTADRGLLFLCYQSDIERQFEFVQSQWVNDPDAPQPGSGHDLVISQSPAQRTLALPGGRPDHVTLMRRFVTTTAGAYFFQPSITALRHLSRPAPAGPPRLREDTDERPGEERRRGDGRHGDEGRRPRRR